MPKSKYYRILGLPNNASENDVRKTYRKLAMRYHPDRNDSPGAEAKFIAISEAYEILTGKKQMPAGRQSRAASKKPGANTASQQAHQAQQAQEQAQRAKEARARYKQQQYDEHVENERYYQKLTNGVKWKTIRFSAVVGVLLSLMIVADYFLPFHYTDDQVTHYSLSHSRGFNGNQVSLIQTENEDYYWIERINYALYGRDYDIYVESSWIFHNPVRIISKGKTKFTPFTVNFNFYKLGWLLAILFLIPAFTLFYKRRKISFTVLFHFSYYGINGLMLIYLLSGNRWAHVLTLGYL